MNLTHDECLQDSKTSDAVIRCIEVLGNAYNKISEDIQVWYPISWRDIGNMRSRLIHGYCVTDLEEI